MCRLSALLLLVTIFTISNGQSSDDNINGPFTTLDALLVASAVILFATFATAITYKIVQQFKDHKIEEEIASQYEGKPGDIYGTVDDDIYEEVTVSAANPEMEIDLR